VSTCSRALCERLIKHLSDRTDTPSIQKADVGRETVMHLVAIGRGVSLTSEATIASSLPDVAFRPIPAVILRSNSVLFGGQAMTIQRYVAS
jgi:hypothetical protein